jgi:glycosyltransferase involved in cell wall biosynthesis
VVAPSAAFAAETARIYALRDEVIAVHNGREQPGISGGEPAAHVLTASRLWDDGKNVATLDAAAAELHAPFRAAGATRGPNGAGIHFEHLEPLGQLTQSGLQRLIAERPVFASAALYEPFGLSVLEAAQAGCALVLSDIATHRELWGDAALYVPARDAGGFAAAIQSLLDNPAKRAECGDAARLRARRYTPTRTAEAMAALYADVLASAARKAPRLQFAGAA